MRKAAFYVTLVVISGLFQACSDGVSVERESCTLANMLPKSSFRWSDMSSYETGAQSCMADVISSMTSSQLNTFIDGMESRGFTTDEKELSTNYYTYEFTKVSADTTYSLTFDYDLTDGAVMGAMLSKKVQQYIHGDIDRLVATTITPYLNFVTAYPSLVSWTGSRTSLSATNVDYLAKDVMPLNSFISQLMISGWQDGVISFESGVWEADLNKTFNGSRYTLQIQVVAKDGYTGNDWDTAVSKVKTNKLSMTVTKVD